MDKNLVKMEDLDMDLELCSTDAELERYLQKYDTKDERIKALWKYMNVTGVTRMGVYDEDEEYAITKDSFLMGFWKKHREVM